MSRSFPPGAVVVITGASSGNGRAAALEFARAGARLALCGRRQDALAEAVRDCERLGAAAFSQVLDVGEWDQVEAFAEAAVARYGALDVWVNNAAVLQYGRFEDTPPEAVEQVVRTNVIGCFNGSRAALRRFRPQGRGVLTNTSSVLGMVGHPYTAAYTATKFALRGFTDSLRQEASDLPDVHVCTLLPAAIDTPIYARAANYTGRAVRPVRPLYSPEVVGRAAVELARRPRRQRYAGAGFAAMVQLGSALTPGLAERVVTGAANLLEFRRREHAADPGNLYRPRADGGVVDGGWRRRYGPSADGRVLLGAAVIGVLGLAAATRGAARRLAP